MGIATNAWYIFQDVEAPEESETFNTQGDTLNLQLFGEASACNLQVFGQIDSHSNSWVVLNAINMTTLELDTSIEKQGIYMVPIEGVSKIQFKLNSVAGGKLSVFGRITRG